MNMPAKQLLNIETLFSVFIPYLNLSSESDCMVEKNWKIWFVE
jgi:hypothetical protein